MRDVLFPLPPSEHGAFVLGFNRKGRRLRVMTSSYMRADRNKYRRVSRDLPFPGGSSGCRWKVTHTPSGRRILVAKA